MLLKQENTRDPQRVWG